MTMCEELKNKLNDQDTPKEDKTILLDIEKECIEYTKYLEERLNLSVEEVKKVLLDNYMNNFNNKERERDFSKSIFDDTIECMKEFAIKQEYPHVDELVNALQKSFEIASFKADV